MDENGPDPHGAEHHLQALLDNIPDFIFFKDTDSRFTLVNQAYAAGVGLDIGQVMGKTDADFFLPVEAQEYLADEHHLLTTGEALIGKSGSWKHTSAPTVRPAEC